MFESSTIARRRALGRLESSDAVVEAARPLWRVVASRIVREGLAAFKAGADVTANLEGLQGTTALALTDVMVAAHLKARFDVATLAAAAMSVGKRADLIDDTIEFLTRRMKVTKERLAELQQIYGDEAVQIAGDLSKRANQRIAEEISQSIADGETVELGVERLEKAFASLGLAPDNDYTLESIWRTQTAVAYSAGEWNAYQDEAVDEILWGYEYTTVGDDRVRPEHQALEGTRLPKDDPKWREIWPPNGWGCRCVTVPIFKTDLEAGEVQKPESGGGPDEGWDFNAGEVFRDLLANAMPLAASLGDDCGCALGCSRGRDRVLLALHALGGHAMQKDIARLANRDKASVSTAVNSLADAGFVHHDAAGRRGCWLTDAGRAELIKLQQRSGGSRGTRGQI